VTRRYHAWREVRHSWIRRKWRALLVPVRGARLVLPALIALSALLVLLALVLDGCSGTAVQRQARALDVTARTINAAVPLVLVEYRRAQMDLVRAHCGPADAGPCRDPVSARREVDALRARWAPVWLAYAGLRATQDAYATQLEACQASDAGCAPSLGTLGSALLRHQLALRCALVAVGVPDPIGGAVDCADLGAPVPGVDAGGSDG
jgi:hypothetical protein